MSNMCIGNEKGKLSLKSKVLLGVLALAVIAGLGTGVYAASATSAGKLLSGQTGIGILDPFTLQSTRLSVLQRVSVSESDSDMVPVMLLDEIITPPEIRIPFRPALRTPFRPPLVLR